MALRSRLPGAGPPRGSALSRGLGFTVTETGGEEGASPWLAGQFVEGEGLAASHHLPCCGPVSSGDDSGPLHVLSAAPRVPEDRRAADGGTQCAGPSVVRAARGCRPASSPDRVVSGQKACSQAAPGWPVAGHCVQAPVHLPWPFVTATDCFSGLSVFPEVPAQQESRHGCCVIQSHACHPSGVTQSLRRWGLWAPSTLLPTLPRGLL